MPHGRDDVLRALLPPLDGEYSFDALSQAETAALEAAFGDGFGDAGAAGYLPMPPPSEVKGGLTRHSYFVSRTSEYDHEGFPDDFWEWSDDRPPPYEFFPLNFVLRRLRLYFSNQVDRFCAQLIRDEPNYESVDREWLESIAFRRLYEKPWYEIHAVQLIGWIEGALKDTADQKLLNLSSLLSSSFSGTLGRLVEQYYWKFRYEKAAVTGIGSRQGASSGGKAKAKAHVAEHSAWQKTATAIWVRKPQLTKTAVAKSVKAQLRVTQTAKHIARFIKRP
jgi:hypothetical protein